MKLPYRMIACILVSLAPAVGTYAQTEPSASTPSEETIKLPQFTIQAAQNDTSLTSQQSVSTSRIATDVFNLPSTVKVINRSFLDEINPQAFSDVFNYVAGGQPGTLSWTSGRFIFRGFAGDGDYEDGFNFQTQSNVDEFIFDRVEIVLSANSTENSSTPPGGAPNKITKAPTAYTFAQLGVTYGAFDSGEARLDAGGPITKDKKLQYRVIATQTDYHGYYDYTTFHRTLLAAMVKYQFSPDTQITVKQWGWKTYFPSYNPPPLDPNTLSYWPGLSYKRNVSENKPFNWRKDRVEKTDFLLTSRLSPFLALRISAITVNEQDARVEAIATDWTDGGSNIGGFSAQPGSGEFAAKDAQGHVFLAPYVQGGPNSLMPRAITAQKQSLPDRDLQTDFNFNFNTGPVSENFLVGGEFSDGSSREWDYPGTANPIDIYNKTAPTVLVNFANPSTAKNNLNQTAKLLTLGTVGFLKDRIVLDYGWTRVINTQDQENNLPAAVFSNVNTPNPVTTTSQYYVYENLRTYGAVVHPIPSIALFYNNTDALGTVTAPNNGVPQPVGLNKSQELGIRWRGMDNRLNARVSYFQATSTNNSVPSFPLNPAAPTVLIGGVVSHGFDGDLTWDMSRNFTVLLTAADYNAHAVAQPANVAVIQPGLVGAAYGVNGAGIAPTAANTLPYGVPVDDAAEKSGSIFGRYTFTDGVLKGFDIALGVDYLSKRAITNNANQVFFGYIPARTLLNLFADYKFGRHFVFSLNIDNLLDTKYIWASRSVNVIEPGTPINFKGTVTYNF
jgi:iron complex outermembrane recepter protein